MQGDPTNEAAEDPHEPGSQVLFDRQVLPGPHELLELVGLLHGPPGLGPEAAMAAVGAVMERMTGMAIPSPAPVASQS